MMADRKVRQDTPARGTAESNKTPGACSTVQSGSPLFRITCKCGKRWEAEVTYLETSRGPEPLAASPCPGCERNTAIYRLEEKQ